MKKIFTVLFIVFFGINLPAQNVNFDWAKQLGGTIYNYSTYGTVDAAGNVYSTGYLTGTVDFDPGPGVYNLTVNGTGTYVTKFDPSGNLIWAIVVQGATFGTIWSREIYVDAFENVYITGSFVGEIDFDPGPGVHYVHLGPENAFILKLNSSGNFVWEKNLSGAGAQANVGISLKVDNTGNVYLCGTFGSLIDFDPGPGVHNLYCPSGIDIFILKFDISGNFIWVKQIAAPGQLLSNEFPFALHLDNTGNIVIVGTFYSTTDFDPGPATHNLTSAGDADVFVLKLDANGNFIWAKSIGTSTIEGAISVVTGSNNAVYIGGYFNGSTVDFDPGSGVFNITPFGGTDIFIMKLDAGGNFVWAKQIGGIGDQSSNKIGIDVAQNIYVTGTFSGPADFDPGPGSYIFTATGSYNTFILKLNKDGNFIWAKTIEGYYSGTTSMAIDAQKNVITTGEFERTSDFDPGPGLFNMTAISNRGNIFVHKLSQVCLTNTFHTLNVSTCISFLLNENVYDSSGTYTQIIPNAAGCDSTITLNLIINRKFTSVNATICEGQTYYAGGSNQTTAGIYKDTLLTSLGCDSVITTDLKVNPKPKPDLGPDGNICTNSQGSITPGLFNSYIWQDNSTQPTFTVNNPGNYWVTVTDANNCSATDTLNIISIDTIPKNFLPPNQDLCYGNVLKITVPNYFTYQWSTGSTGDFIDVSKFGTYYLTVKDFNSCTGTDSITIQRKNCIYMGIPNAFTPNGDTKNDIFKPEIFQAVKAFSFIVFNRYGQTVFETREYGKGWDGTLKGKPQPSGSYVYYIKYTNIFGVETIENGSVLLIR